LVATAFSSYGPSFSIGRRRDILELAGDQMFGFAERPIDEGRKSVASWSPIP
jgi:hypothetical protein